MSKEVVLLPGPDMNLEGGFFNYAHVVAGTEVGYLSFWQKQEGLGYEVGVMNTTRPGGVGKKMIEKMIQVIGTHMPVVGTTIEEDTLSRLNELSFLDIIRESKSEIVIQDRDIFSQLKMVRIFEGGGLRVRQIAVRYTKDEYYNNYKEELNNAEVQIFASS